MNLSLDASGKIIKDTDAELKVKLEPIQNKLNGLNPGPKEEARKSLIKELEQQNITDPAQQNRILNGLKWN